MKSFKAHIQNQNSENISSYTKFARAITGKRFTRESILKNFNKFVEKADYVKEDKKLLIDHLYLLSNPLEEAEK